MRIDTEHDAGLIKNTGLRREYLKFLRRKRACPEHDGKWYHLDKPNNAIILNYKPIATLKKFHFADTKFRAMGGGFGDGKTLALCQEAILLAMEYPNSLGLIGRATYPELRDTTRKMFLDVCPKPLIENFNKTENHLWLRNGSEIIFRALTAISEEDKSKFKNINLGWFAVDQAEEIEEEIFDLLRGRLRQKEGPRRAFIAFNSEGHNWIWEKWVKYPKKEYRLFMAHSFENPYLPEDYLWDLIVNNPEEWTMRYVMGSFDVFKGKIFKDFDMDTHVIDEFEPPANWTRYRSIDWGYRHPTACLWAAISPENDIYIYGGTSQSELSPQAQAAMIRSSKFSIHRNEDSDQIEPYNFVWTTIDPATNKRDPNTGETIKEMFDMAGVPTVDANNDVPAGIAKLAQLFRGEGRKIKICRNCVDLIDEIMNYKWIMTKGTQGKEKPKKDKDDSVDALRYLVMSDPTFYDPTKEYQDDVAEHYWRDPDTGY